jgi:hypothetical protein
LANRRLITGVLTAALIGLAIPAASAAVSSTDSPTTTTKACDTRQYRLPPGTPVTSDEGGIWGTTEGYEGGAKFNTSESGDNPRGNIYYHNSDGWYVHATGSVLITGRTVIGCF